MIGPHGEAEFGFSSQPAWKVKGWKRDEGGPGLPLRDCPGCGAPENYPPAGPCRDHGTPDAYATNGDCDPGDGA